MYKAYKFRLYPDSEQKQLINKTFGCTRFVYNYFLNKSKELGYIKAYDMCKELEKEYTFLKEVDSLSLRYSIFNLEDSYKNKLYSSIEIDLRKKNVKLPKLGLVNIKGYRNLKEINGNIINTTIEKQQENIM